MIRALAFGAALATCGCQASAQDPKADALVTLFQDVCVANGSLQAGVAAVARTEQWSAVGLADPVQPDELAWEVEHPILGLTHIGTWTGEVDGKPHHLCMIIVDGVDAREVVREVRERLRLPLTINRPEDGGRQDVYWWSFQRADEEDYLEVRQVPAGNAAGNASIALGTPVR